MYMGMVGPLSLYNVYIVVMCLKGEVIVLVLVVMLQWCVLVLVIMLMISLLLAGILAAA